MRAYIFLSLVFILGTPTRADEFDSLIKPSPSATPVPQNVAARATNKNSRVLPPGKVGVRRFGPSIPMYRAGHYPSGTFYRVPQLAQLASAQLPKNSYLIGRFLYLGQSGGRHLFVPFVLLPSAYLKVLNGQRVDNLDIAQGQTKIEVVFHNNFPPALFPGKAIAPNSSEPLIIRKVFQSVDGLHVQTECLSQD
jgi:hypothetical protein